MSEGAFSGEYTKIVAVTTTTKQILPSDQGTMFTNRAAGGNIAYTLPVTTTIQSGWWCEFFNVAAGTVTVASYGSLDDIVYMNDLTADSLAFSTGGEIIGGSLRFEWDGTGWLVSVMVAKGQTITKA
jgi:hypothetical protein